MNPLRWDAAALAPGHPPFSDRGDAVHAVMITGKDPARFGLATRSLVSFLEQTHENRRLIVVNDGLPIEIAGAPPGRIVHVQVHPGETRPLVGTLRNVGLEQLEEDAIWVQWDDDDWHHPALIAEQLAVLKSTSALAVTMRAQIRYAFEKNAAWVERMPPPTFGFAGTLMARNRAGLRYPGTELGEDSTFLTSLIATERVVPWDNPPNRYLRMIHGSNSWGRSHFRLHRLPTGRWLIDPADRPLLASVLRSCEGAVEGWSYQDPLPIEEE